MKEITIQEFVEGYEQGCISDIIAVKDKVYGKECRGIEDPFKLYEVVWASIP